MAMYSVKWFRADRAGPMVKWFHSKVAANKFRETLGYLSEPPKRDVNS